MDEQHGHDHENRAEAFLSLKAADYDHLDGEERAVARGVAMAFHGGGMGELSPLHKAYGVAGLIGYQSMVYSLTEGEDDERAVWKALRMSTEDFLSVRDAAIAQADEVGHGAFKDGARGLEVARDLIDSAVWSHLTDRYNEFRRSQKLTATLQAANRELVAASVDLEDTETNQVNFDHDDAALAALAEKHGAVYQHALDNGFPARDLVGLIREAQSPKKGGELGIFTDRAHVWAKQKQFAEPHIVVGDLRHMAHDRTIAWTIPVADYDSETLTKVRARKQAKPTVGKLPQSEPLSDADKAEVEHIANRLGGMFQEDPSRLENTASLIAITLREARAQISDDEPHAAQLRAALKPTDRDLGLIYEGVTRLKKGITATTHAHMQKKVDAVRAVARDFPPKITAPSF